MGGGADLLSRFQKGFKMSKAKASRNYYKEQKQGGKRPVTIFLTKARYEKLAERAEALGVPPTGLVRILIHSLLEDTAGGEE